jgi:NNP family nitrate/nitrite transporter-like MFS transporter
MSPVFMGYSHAGVFRGEAPSFVSFRQLLGNLSVWVMVLLFSLGIISTMGIYTMLPLYLVSEYGMDANLANTLLALSRIPSIIIVFFGGWATDRIGPLRMIKIVLLFTGLMTLLMGIASRWLISYIIFLQPLLAACFFPAGFAAMSFMVPAQLRNIAISLIIPLTIVVGGGLAPVFIGFISDMGNFGLAFIIFGGLITAGSFFTGVFKFYDQQT